MIEHVSDIKSRGGLRSRSNMSVTLRVEGD